jgi:flavodoxin/ferredoxin
MKIQLLYYSGAGNTKFIANSIEEALSRKNYDVNTIKISEKSINSLNNDFDILILGSPVYFRETPELVNKILDKISGENRPIMVFLTKGLYSGNTYKNIHKKSIENNFIPIGLMEIFMPGTDLLTLVIKEKSFLENFAISIHSKKINKKIDNFIGKIGKNKPIKNVLTKWYTFFDELIVKKAEIKADNSHKDWIGKFTVNVDNCIYCKKCINGCPHGNIELNEKIAFGINCDVCFYCINNCPKYAIYLSETRRNNVRYSEEKINKIFSGILEKQTSV